MNISLKIASSIVLVMTIAVILSAGTAAAKDVSLMTTDELKDILTDKDVLILDTRSGRDWSASEFKIQGAVRAAPDKVDTWAGNFEKDKKVVTYCA